MTQADIFKNKVLSDPGRGFAIGECLPEEPGKMGGVLVFNLEAKPRMSDTFIVSGLIESLGKKPSRSNELRARQLKHLFSLAYQEHRHMVIVIRDSHLLPPKTIKKLKGLRENQDGQHPGIVLLGDMTRLARKINKLPEISQRASIITASGRLEPWPSIIKL